MKKTIYFILMGAFLILSGCSKSDDIIPEDNLLESQLKSANTNTIQDKWTITNYYTALICDGEVVDYVEGSIDGHFRVHMKDGIPEFAIVNYSGILVSGNGEVLTVKESLKINFETYVQTVRWNIKGDNGSHYIGSGYLYWNTWDLVAEKTVCPPVNSSDTWTVKHKLDNFFYSTPLICDGVEVDHVSGNINAHILEHYKDGVIQFVLINQNGTLTSDNGEVLTIKQSDKIDFKDYSLPIYTVRWNIKGENGNHYIGSGYIDLGTWDLVAEKTVCPPANSADTKTENFWEQWPISIPLICDGVEVDYVAGSLDAHIRVHKKDDVILFAIINVSGTLESDNGEVLTIKESEKLEFNDGEPPVWTFRWNIKGEDGNHYIGSGYFNWYTGELIVEKAICPPGSD